MNSFYSFLKEIIALFLFVLCTTIFVYPQSKEGRALEGFRNLKWGSSMNNVRSAETETYMQVFHGFGIDALSYKGTLANLPARIDYSFKDGKLYEGTYTIIPENNFRNSFKNLKEFLTNNYGKPDFRNGSDINSDSVWIKVTDYGEFRGPELYWKFSNGFIGVIATKFEEEITLTVLFSSDSSITNYGKENLISTDAFKKH